MSEHELWNELGNLYFMSGAYEPAIYAYTRSINLDPNFGRPYSNLALAYVEKGKYVEAIELFRKSIELLVDNKEKAITMNRLGNAYRQLKDYKNAVMVYQKADELDPSVSNGPEQSVQDVQALLTLSMPALDLKVASLVQSPVEEDQLPTFNPGDNQVPVQPDKTASWFADGMIPPEPLDVLEPDSYAESDEMEIDEAPVLDLSDWSIPIPDPIRTNEALWHLGSPTEAQIAEETENSAFSMIEISEPTESVEMDNQTVTETESVQYTQADYPLIELSDGELTAIENDIAKFARVVHINPRNGLAWYTLGNLYKSVGRYKEAIFSYQQAISSDSSKAPYYYHLGLVFAAEKRYEDAINSFLKVIEIDPNYSLAHATLGGHYRKLGLEDLAQHHIKKAMGKAFLEENEYNRACLEAICGNTDDAIDLLQVALNNKQTYADWARRDPDLDFIRNDPRFQALISAHLTTGN